MDYFVASLPQPGHFLVIQSLDLMLFDWNAFPGRWKSTVLVTKWVRSTGGDSVRWGSRRHLDLRSPMVVFMIDADNLSAPAWLEEAFGTLESGVGEITVRRAYGSGENLKGLSEVMRAKAIRPFLNFPISKNTTDLALAVDAMELACQTPRPSVVVIGSGDADFVPLAVRLRERGIRMLCVSELSKCHESA